MSFCMCEARGQRTIDTSTEGFHPWQMKDLQVYNAFSSSILLKLSCLFATKEDQRNNPYMDNPFHGGRLFSFSLPQFSPSTFPLVRLASACWTVPPRGGWFGAHQSYENSSQAQCLCTVDVILHPTVEDTSKGSKRHKETLATTSPSSVRHLSDGGEWNTHNTTFFWATQTT